MWFTLKVTEFYKGNPKSSGFWTVSLKQQLNFLLYKEVYILYNKNTLRQKQFILKIPIKVYLHLLP